jgi:glucokinase
MERPLALGVDVGGTKVKAALVGGKGSIIGGVGVIDSHSHEDADTIMTSLCGGLACIMSRFDSPVVGVGIGMPGPFDYERGISYIRGLDKYDSLYGMNIGERLRECLALPSATPLSFITDAAAFAFGECAFGAGRHFSRVLAITLGTGCGSAFVVNGDFATMEGVGASPDGYIYSMPYRDSCVDDYISRRGILNLWHCVYEQKARKAGTSLDEDLDVADLARHALRGDRVTSELFETWGQMMAQAIAPAIEHLRPDCVIIGGAIGQSLALFRAPLDRYLAGLDYAPVLAQAADVHSGVRGAGAYVLMRLGKLER